MSDTISCPKCKSTQFHSGKKGFSGKKAVAGVVVTGGIGALAGTIGSNKVQMTCLSCGTVFYPGSSSQINSSDAASPQIGAFMFFVIGILALVVSLVFHLLSLDGLFSFSIAVACVFVFISISIFLYIKFNFKAPQNVGIGSSSASKGLSGKTPEEVASELINRQQDNGLHSKKK